MMRVNGVGEQRCRFKGQPGFLAYKRVKPEIQALETNVFPRMMNLLGEPLTPSTFKGLWASSMAFWLYGKPGEKTGKRRKIGFFFKKEDAAPRIVPDCRKAAAGTFVSNTSAVCSAL